MAFARRRVAGVDHDRPGQRDLAAVPGEVAGAHLGQELHHTLTVPAVWRWGRVELGGDAFDLGPDRQPAVGILRFATPLDAGAAVGAVDRDVALVVRDPLGPAGLQQQGATVGEPEERGRQVLDVELSPAGAGLAGDAIADPPLPRGPNSAYVAAVAAFTCGSPSR